MSSPIKHIHVVLVDDHPALRAGVRGGLERRNVRVIDEAASAHDAVASISRLGPDAAVVDDQFLERHGPDVIARMRASGDHTPLVVLGERDEVAVVERCLLAGADAFVAKRSELDVLLDAIDAVVAGRSFVDPAVTSALLEQRGSARLSDRELEVLQLMCDGQQNKQIAHALSLGEETVKSHVAGVMRLLGATSRTHAVAIALRTRLVT